MHVAIVTQFPRYPDSPSGGVESVSVSLVRSLTNHPGCEITVVTTGRNIHAYFQTKWNGASIHYLPWAGGPVLLHAISSGRRQFRRFLKSLNPDLIHSHDTYGLLVNHMDFPGVFTIHGFIYADTKYQSGKLAWLRSAAWKVVEMRGWAKHEHIISISPYVSGRIRSIVKSTLHEIDNPIDSRFFGVQRQRQGNGILSVAHVSRLKNTLGLLQAFAIVLENVPDAFLKLAGEANDREYLQRVHEFISANGLNEHVCLLGSLAIARIADELAAAAVLVHLSIQENAPMCIAEAMAAGVPVVATNRFGIPHMVVDGISGYLVEPNNSQDVAGKIIQVLTDDTLNDQMSQAGRRIATERFSPDAVSSKTLGVYQQIAAHPGLLLE
ncbi:MAG: glycosyltransferase family 4 protein [Verrucomicrobiota bacterium]